MRLRIEHKLMLRMSMQLERFALFLRTIPVRLGIDSQYELRYYLCLGRKTRLSSLLGLGFEGSDLSDGLTAILLVFRVYNQFRRRLMLVSGLQD